MPEQVYDGGKFRQLALYLAGRSGDDPAFGKTKLAKLLFFSDFLAYGELGVSISGATYVKDRYGPSPDCLDEEIERIVAAGAGMIVRRRYHGHEQQRLTPSGGLDASALPEAERAIADRVLEELREDDAGSASRRSHLEPAWKYVDLYEPIPYGFVFVSPEPLSAETIRIGQEVAARLGRA